jgi:hypothetical protein
MRRRATIRAGRNAPWQDRVVTSPGPLNRDQQRVGVLCERATSVKPPEGVPFCRLRLPQC